MGGWRGLSALLALLALCGGILLVNATAAAAAGSYVSLGDSYSSGDGTGVYYSSSGSCYRSPDAYPPLVAAAEGDTLNFQACSGATTSTVISSQLSALGSSTNLVTITIGGNDAGFATVMEDCALYFFPCQSAISTANAYIKNSLPGVLNTTYNDIRADAPNAQVIVLGYPLLFTAGGATCGIDLLTSGNEKSLNATGVALDGAIQGAVGDRAGFTYVNPQSAFASHEDCSSSPWLNGVTLPLVASFHPNIPGEAELATLVEGAL